MSSFYRGRYQVQENLKCDRYIITDTLMDSVKNPTNLLTLLSEDEDEYEKRYVEEKKSESSSHEEEVPWKSPFSSDEDDDNFSGLPQPCAGKIDDADTSDEKVAASVGGAKKKVL
ncbi:hypothetical protein DMENIID0001_126490 [Sergentomyia squamirostris]